MARPCSTLATARVGVHWHYRQFGAAERWLFALAETLC